MRPRCIDQDAKTRLALLDSPARNLHEAVVGQRSTAAASDERQGRCQQHFQVSHRALASTAAEALRRAPLRAPGSALRGGCAIQPPQEDEPEPQIPDRRGESLG